MADLLVGYDPGAPVGERLAPEVRTEIALLAPNTVPDGSVISSKLGALAVNEAALGNNAVGSAKIKTGAITGAKIATEAIITDHLIPGAVTREKVAAGVATTVDANDNAISLKLMLLTAAQYAALTPSSDTLYLIT